MELLKYIVLKIRELYMSKIKKRNIIIVVILLIIILLLSFFLLRSTFYQKQIENIFDSAFVENSYENIDYKNYISEKDWKKIKYGFVGEEREENIKFDVA